ncbi:trypsin theta-like [Eurosta solidaginis]|uniref:trypsin theta-like n=1 Tax=Eurosta solidaginis TaxID=178769 RepID=UPI003530D252
MASKLLCVLTLLSATASTYADGIQGGIATSITTHPYYVSIQYSSGIHICGGALISPDIVITSASCVANNVVSELYARVGSNKYASDGQEIPIAAYTFDRSCDFVTNEYDVGLFKLAKPIKASSTVGIIEVASSKPVTGTSGVVIGWNTNEDLVEVPVDIISSSDCASGPFRYNEDDLFDSHVCGLAESSEACGGESGSPLVSNNQLVGLVSWGYACSNKGNPAIYTNIAAVKSWIASASNTL